ncbi:MAG: hypothetical protein ACTHK2_18590 [Dokdonella sp.]|uniref:hypothetical protein n=1 Tax=Dokdonella sp. TaxID=2291710 RepID=UPI003F81EEBF
MIFGLSDMGRINLVVGVAPGNGTRECRDAGMPPGASDAVAGRQAAHCRAFGRGDEAAGATAADHTMPSGKAMPPARPRKRGIFTLRCMILAWASPC